MADFTSGDLCKCNYLRKNKQEEFTKEDLQSIDATSDEKKKFVANQMFDLGLPSLQKVIDELTSLVTKAEDLISGDALTKDTSILADDENSMDTKIFGITIMDIQSRMALGSCCWYCSRIKK